MKMALALKLGEQLYFAAEHGDEALVSSLLAQGAPTTWTNSARQGAAEQRTQGNKRLASRFDHA